MHRTKRFNRGIKQPLIERTLPPRSSRHGQPVTKRVRQVITDPKTNLVKVVFMNVPVTGERKMRVAAGPTANYGRVNDGGPDANKKAAKPKK